MGTRRSKTLQVVTGRGPSIYYVTLKLSFISICPKIAFDIPITHAITTTFHVKQNNIKKPPIIVKRVSPNVRNKFLHLYGKAKGLQLIDIGIESEGRIIKQSLKVLRYAKSLKLNKATTDITTFNGLVHVQSRQTDSYTQILSKKLMDEYIQKERNNEILDNDNESRSFTLNSNTPTLPLQPEVVTKVGRIVKDSTLSNKSI